MKQEIKKEIATIARDILNPVFMGLLMNQDDTLLTRGNGKGLKIYDDLERDCHAFSVLQKRKMAVIARGWEVEPASKSALDVRAAEMVTEHFKAIDFDKLTVDLLDALLKGYSVGEVMWGQNGREIYIDRFIPRNQRRFIFDSDYKLRLLTMENMTQGELMPDKKFIVHTYGGKDGTPYGLGLGSRLFWPVFFKRQDITFWLTFADKFGSPTLLGKYPDGTLEADQVEFINNLANMAQDAAIGIPESHTLDLLEAKRAGGGDVFEKLARYMDEQISVAVLGETMTTSGSSSGLGGNQSGTHNEVRLELVKADADLLSGTLNGSVVKWLTEFNTPGATPPRIKRVVEEEDDLSVHAKRDTEIYKMGFKPTLEYITSTYGTGWEVRVAGESPTTNVGAAQFAEGEPAADQQALDDAIELLASEDMQGSMDKLLEPIASLVSNNTPEQLRNILTESYAELDADGLQEIMARAFFVAEVWGKLNATNE